MTGWVTFEARIEPLTWGRSTYTIPRLPDAAAPALAEDAPLAMWRAYSGPLPPEFAWDTAITFRTDGTVDLQHRTGYPNDGLACQTATGQADPAALKAIVKVARASALATRPATEVDDVPVGGGFVEGSVWLDGAEIALPPIPQPRMPSGSARCWMRSGQPCRRTLPDGPSDRWPCPPGQARSPA